MKKLRKINSIVSLVLVVLILLHGMMAGFQLLGIGSHAGVSLALAGACLLAVHTAMGIIFTGQTVRAAFRSGGRLYLRDNAVFWIKRLTGLAIILLVFFHLGIFTAEIDGNYVLLPFTAVKLAGMLALAAAVFLHIFVNIRSMLISMGVLADGRRRRDIMVFLSVILAFISIALVLYYISWCI